MEILTLIIKQKFLTKSCQARKYKNSEKSGLQHKRNTASLTLMAIVSRKTVCYSLSITMLSSFVGYNKDRASALVEVKDAKIELFEDENHNLIEYTYQGEIYLAAQVVYDLGRIIEKHV